MYSYLKCIVYDKLLKPRQSFLITLYKYLIHFYSNTAVYQNGHPTTELLLPNKVTRTSVIAILLEAHNDVCAFKHLLCIFQKGHEPAKKQFHTH